MALPSPRPVNFLRHCTHHRPQTRPVPVQLEEMVAQAVVEPKVRKQRVGISKATKEKRKQDKRFRSDVKGNRGSVKY